MMICGVKIIVIKFWFNDFLKIQIVNEIWKK